MEHILVGKTITAIQIADDKKAILFHTTDGPIIAKCDGDCCSDTYIWSIGKPALGYPALVVETNSNDSLHDDEYVDYVCTSYYSFTIATNHGEIVIEYRNESNGYYGGRLSWPEDYYYGGVFGQNISTQKWVEIEE